MKRFIGVFFTVLLSTSLFTGCKKFLNIVPVDNLSGNNFWQTRKDVEGFTNGIYAIFRSKTAGTGAYFPSLDIRCSPMKTVSGANYVGLLAKNDIKGLQNPDQQWSSGFTFKNLTVWKEFYDMVQAANVLYVQVDKVPDANFSPASRKQYRAEAVFLRNLAYFFMVRQFGDVPYYTKAYHQDPLPRMPMVEVLNKCIADLMAVKNDLPWTYDDPSKVGVRAMRGGAIALLMHMNMWAAGFDAANKDVYYKAVKSLGAELLNNENSYQLLPLTPENSKLIFKGRTKESLFEILQNANYGEAFAPYASISFLLVHYPYRGRVSDVNSAAYYDTKFITQIYPGDAPDKRKTIWMDNITSTTGKFQLLKFINVYSSEGQEVKNDDDIIVFRYADALLLTAEALAELGEDDESRKYLNMVRERAGALTITTGGDGLKNDIYWERCRELMGEGHYFYDLVRTKRILSDEFCWNPISVSDYNQRAWTWPVDESALANNPQMTLNDFWK